MKIKKGDNVIVISGSNKGKTGVVVKAFRAEGKVLIDGVNMKKKHQKARRKGEKGQIIEMAVPLPASNVMIVDPKTKARTRISIKQTGKKKVRVAKKSGTEI
jgi:large subunit ribosomal protein L24